MQRTKSRMQRTRRKRVTKKVHAILTSDWHIRETKPVCRTDDFWTAQWNSVAFVRKLQEQYQCPVLHAGDLFNYWKPSPFLISYTLLNLPEQFHTVYGQHDLPQHNIELAEKSGIHAIETAERLTVLQEAHWTDTPDKGSLVFPFERMRTVCVWHHMVWKNKKPYPGVKEAPARQVLKKYPEFDLFVTGDNHDSFVEEVNGRLLVNPGPLTRQTADQINYQPRVFLWHGYDNTVTPKDIPIIHNVISREHIDKMQRRDRRIAAFIERLDTDWEKTTSFEDNLERFFHRNKIKKPIQDIVFQAMEDTENE